MSALVYFRTQDEIAGLLGTGPEPDPGNPLIWRFEDFLGNATGTLTFSPGAGGLVRRAVLEDVAGEDLLRLSGIALAPEVLEGLGGATSLDFYGAAMVLLDDATSVTGSAGDDDLEHGGGDDTVAGGLGDDRIWSWRPGDLVVDGGAGGDTLHFQNQFAVEGAPEPVQGVVVNLATGTGTGAFGGTIRLQGIEAVVGTALADRLTGDDGQNSFGDGLFDTGADTIRAGGGEDIIRLSEDSQGAQVDGGEGRDRLIVVPYAPAIPNGDGTFQQGRAVLDLANPDRNTEAFEGVTIENVEIFEVGRDLPLLSIWVFRGDARPNTAIGADKVPGTTLPSGKDALSGRGGNDQLFGLSGVDRLEGGAGDDTLHGGRGIDRLTGGEGADRMTGGVSADTFVWRAASDSTPDAPDRLVAFESGIDRLSLSGVAALAFVGAGAFDGPGQVRVVAVGEGARVEVNLTGRSGAEMVILVDSGVPEAGDFI